MGSENSVLDRQSDGCICDIPKLVHEEDSHSKKSMSKRERKLARKGKAGDSDTSKGTDDRRKGKSRREEDHSTIEEILLTSKLEALALDAKPSSTEDEELPKHVLYYGWFFDNEVSLIIKDVADKFLQESLKIPQFQRFLSDACISRGANDPLGFYKKPGKSKTSEELTYHLTAKFLGREPNTDYSIPVQKFVGKQFGIHLIGLFFTPQTFGIRVKLTKGQKEIFDEERKISSGSSSNDALSSSTHQKKNSTSKRTQFAKSLPTTNSESSLAAMNSNLISTKLLQEELIKDNLGSHATKNLKCKAIKRFSPESEKVLILPRRTENVFHPTKSRAHITIGCAPKVKAIQTGIDLLEIVDLENRIVKNASGLFHQDYEIEGGTLRQFGRYGDAFVIYPCHQLQAEATFNFFR